LEILFVELLPEEMKDSGKMLEKNVLRSKFQQPFHHETTLL